MLYNVLALVSVLLAIATLIAVVFLIYLINQMLKNQNKPEIDFKKPKNPFKRKKEPKLTAKEKIQADILANVDIYNGTAEGQKEVRADGQ